MRSLLVAFVALIGLTIGANAQCASGYTQLSNVFACQPTSTFFNIGYSTTPTNTYGTVTDSAGTIQGSGPYTMSATGHLQSISMYITTTSSASAYFGVFADNAGAPGALIGQTALTALSVGWNTFPATTNPSVASGSKIWIMILPPSGGNTPFSNTDTTAAGFTWISGSASTLPSTLTGLTQHPSSALTYGGYATFY